MSIQGTMQFRHKEGRQGKNVHHPRQGEDHSPKEEIKWPAHPARLAAAPE